MPDNKRSERLVAMTKILLDHPATLLPLGHFTQTLGAAKSTISEDLAYLREVFASMGLGKIETFPGVAGGVKYLPLRTPEGILSVVEELCVKLRSPQRILPGGFLYMTDIIFSPQWAALLGEAFASLFQERSPEVVITMETKGIPLALMTARALGLPLVTIRHESRVTEGPAVSVTYLSGSNRRIGSMSLPRRALPTGARVIIIDDFMRAGGTVRGMLDLLAEFQAQVVGTGILVEMVQPPEKVVQDYLSLVLLEEVDEAHKKVVVRPNPRLERRG